MTHSFRFLPPEPRPDLLDRPRLLRSLAGRWQRRVTALTGGPGLGKTTLLAQAVAENQLAPRGEDLWVGLEPRDADADGLARVVSAAVQDRVREPDEIRERAREHAAVDPMTVAEAIWGHSPTEECLVLDDVHLLPAGSTGAAWLGTLVAALPANGHVVLASRTDPPVALTRYATRGEVLRLAEDDLRFSDDEISGFARRRGLDPEWLGSTGGWPAMAELVAVAPASAGDSRFTGTYLWEEVLDPLGTMRRHVLAVLCDLGGADDELISAAVGSPVELVKVLDAVPLVTQRANGWYVPHGLWRDAPGLTLSRPERAEVRRRAAEHLLWRGRFDDAFGLVEEAELWDVAPDVLRAACLATDHLVSNELGRWLAASPDVVRTSPEGCLAEGIFNVFTAPARAVETLQQAADQCRAVGDVDAEVTAISRLGQLAWWRQDLEALMELAARVTELEASGRPKARALATFARAMGADLAGDDDEVLAQLSRIEPNVLDPSWEWLAIWLSGVVRLDRGDLDGVLEVVDRHSRTVDPSLRYGLDTLLCSAWWYGGHIDKVFAKVAEVIASARRTGVTYNLYLGLALVSRCYSRVGDVAAARRCYDDSLAVAPRLDGDQLSVHSAHALASLQLAEGDEAAAEATLREAMQAHGLEQGMERRAWRQVLTLSYVLLPESRSHWDAVPLRGHLAVARELSAVVVALRDGSAEARLRTLQLPELGLVRALLHVRFVAELAVGLADVGRSEGRMLLDAGGPAARDAVRDLTESQPRSASAKAARSLLAAVPAPPHQRTYLAVLGPLVLRRGGPDGEEVLDPELRRTRVQMLLAYLVGHRRTNRSTIAATLWPDFDERSAGNNLAVTLNYLVRLLEPWRDIGEPTYLVRMDGPSVRLVTDEYLRIDLDDFEEHLAAAARAERDGTPSLALQSHLAAVELYRDSLHMDVPDADWLLLDREHYRTRFVAAAVRAGQLLVGRGDLEQAQAVARRALAADPWSEDAYAVLVGAALARGDRSGAARLLARCQEALADLGIEPSTATQQLRRRLQGVAPTPG